VEQQSIAGKDRLCMAVRNLFQISLLPRARSLHYKASRMDPSGIVHPVRLAKGKTDG
jgi:hypothetical protein